MVGSALRRIRGTTLALACLCLLFPTTGFADALTMGGTGMSIGIMRVLADAYTKKRPEIRITIPPSVGSGGGIGALLAGKLEVSFSARALKEAEKQQGVRAVPIAESPFVLAVASSITGDLDLSSAEVIKVYTGDLGEWPDGTPVRVLLRPKHETNTRMLEGHFPGIGPVLDKARSARGALIAQSDQEAMDHGERLSGALITGTLMAMLSENRALKPLAIDGVAPTVENLENGSYPMMLTLWAVLGPKTGESARDFIAFVRSKEGAVILRAYGSVPAGTENDG
jgi:phosphate transport system substrate-binding protein